MKILALEHWKFYQGIRWVQVALSGVETNWADTVFVLNATILAGQHWWTHSDGDNASWWCDHSNGSWDITAISASGWHHAHWGHHFTSTVHTRWRGGDSCDWDGNHSLESMVWDLLVVKASVRPQGKSVCKLGDLLGDGPLLETFGRTFFIATRD